MSIQRTVRQVIQLDAEIANLEKHLSALKTKRHMMVTVEIPELLTEFGSFKWEDERYLVNVGTKLTGSLPKDPVKRSDAIDYVREQGGDSIIKSFVEVDVPKGNLKEAKRLARVLKQQTDLDIKVGTDIHPMTLGAWARARIDENKPLNLDTLGLYSLNIATVKQKD